MNLEMSRQLLRFALASINVMKIRSKLENEKQFETMKLLKTELTEVNEEIKTLMTYFKNMQLILLAQKNRLDNVESERIRNESIEAHISRICRSHYEKVEL